MVAFGGAGPVHAYEIARLLNLREVIFPRGAGVASAIGMLVAPRSVEFTRSVVSGVDAVDWVSVKRIVAEIEDQGRSILIQGGVAKKSIATEISADMRYAGQGFEITVPISGRIFERENKHLLRQSFIKQYEARFSRSLGHLPIECVSWRVRVVAPPSVQDVRLDLSEVKGRNTKLEVRPAYFEEVRRYVDTPVFTRTHLKAGTRIKGPALIEEDESTCVIGPSAYATVDKFGNLVMTVHSSE
jgi:N-methylhydantoinase A